MIFPFRNPQHPEDEEEAPPSREIVVPAEMHWPLDEWPPPDLADLPEQERETAWDGWRSRLRRREKIQRVADAAAEEWLLYHASDEVPLFESDGPLFRTLPRPEGLGVVNGMGQALPPPRREEIFKPGLFKTLSRVLVWMRGGSGFLMGVLSDKLRGRDSEERRAKRLRATFETMGTTFIKFGQQLSMRLDFLPYAYTHELEAMLDKVDPMPVEEAIETIERTTGRKLEHTFSAFDRDPIGSASIACVYHAVLRTGEEVAVKVRRTGIGLALAADMRAFGWLLKLAELIIFRPGFTTNFIYELRTMLMEELDFIREARFCELYRRRTRKTRQLNFVTAPRVFFDCSSREVLVAEFVTGIWVSELLTALESDDPEALAKLREMNIDPVILARRIQLIARFNNFEHIFFHADLHPANVLIQPGNKIVLIDFGSCGSFSKRELKSWRRWFDAQSVDDIGGMVQAALSIIEPLPPIDKDDFGLRLESVFWNDLYAIKSKHSDWSERISARLWIGFLKLSREYNVPMRLNTLRMIRASMLADTIAARLDHEQDPYREYRFYAKGAGKRAKKRLRKRVNRLLGPSKFTRIEQGLESTFKLIFRLQRAVDSLDSIGIIPLIGKAAQAMLLVVETAGIVIGMATVWALAILAYQYFAYKLGVGPWPDTFARILWYDVLGDGYFQLIALIPVVIAVRRIVVRLQDRDYGAGGGGRAPN